MADHIHQTLRTFRESMLQSVALLECSLRDGYTSSVPVSQPSTTMSNFEIRIMELENLVRKSFSEFNHSIIDMGLRIQDLEQQIPLFQIYPDPSNKNVIVPQPYKSYSYPLSQEDSVISEIQSDEEHVVEIEEPGDDIAPKKEDVESVHEILEEEPDEEEEVIEVEEEVEEVEEEVEEEIEEIVEEEVEEEEIEEIVEEEVEEEIEEVEEEEEAITLEEIVYKGNTYYKDQYNNVYADEDAETLLGTWNGKKILKTV